ncbi:N-acetyltransferase ECO1 [Tuber brumale]|nr:N-acetyltransferase ECO1 [Tuber brumale]
MPGYYANKRYDSAPPRTTYSRKDTLVTGTTKKRRRTKDVSWNGNTSTGTNTPSPSRSSSIPAPSDDDNDDGDSLNIASSSSSPPPAPVKKAFTGFSMKTHTSVTTTTTTSTASRRRKQPEQQQQQQKKLTQLKIDLGQPQRATCRTCGMSYYPCTPDDDALHRRFHAKSVGGVDFKSTILDAKKSKVVWRGREEDSFVLVVDRKSAVAERRKAREVLEVVESELSAGEIGEDVLWGGVKVGGGEEGGDGGERYRVLLYVVGKKCVGLCLAERIRRAYRVVGDEVRNGVDGEMRSVAYRGSSISVSETSRPAILGISRVWVCADHRRRGIATRLLDCARENFIYGMKIEKDDVAFSQPTESGGALARGWFGADKAHHWAVYVEEV